VKDTNPAQSTPTAPKTDTVVHIGHVYQGREVGMRGVRPMGRSPLRMLHLRGGRPVREAPGVHSQVGGPHVAPSELKIGAHADRDDVVA